MALLFLHGLDSSGFGTKGRYFAEHFPDMLRPNFDGTLQERMSQLYTIVNDYNDLIIVGSSFGGLMGACFCIDYPKRVTRLIMLAPALNFEEFSPPDVKIAVESLLVIGSDDTVTPPDLVIPAAKKSFSNLTVQLVDDDHLLHHYFYEMNWDTLLGEQAKSSGKQH